MSIRIFLVDDEDHAMDLLTMYAERISDVQIVGRETDPAKAVRMILDKEIVADAVFLDIDMPVLGGLSFAGLVRHLVQVVFTTAHRQYAPESYLHDAVDYLLKPVTFERFLVSLEKLRQRLTAQKIGKATLLDHISIPGDGKGTFIVLETKDILYVQGSSNYVTIYTDTREYLTNYSMIKVEQLLYSNQFLRVHKSYIVNLRKIVKADNESIFLTNGKDIPLSETYRKQFMNLMKPR
ncbi:LytTR family DNA-binding domain-containing protein [Pedobacter sp. B4-66]|uniref:LytR/AlgR family response regulator transcription factor n=1 Tax=Pedobacter sp. B4-66 TaxID=2817280 RepID=UPI001BD9F921|nr:LytTR family DNA-binding domain-containing protein [Pedobacter sp. B4-66]